MEKNVKGFNGYSVENNPEKVGKKLKEAIMDRTNERMDRLCQVIVRRDEHGKLEERMVHLEQEMHDIKMKLAA